VTDHWSRPAAPYGWGPPLAAPGRTPRWAAPLAAVVGVALLAGGAAYAFRPRVRVATPVPAAAVPVHAAPAPRQKPHPAARPSRQPARTYVPPAGGVAVRGRVVDVTGHPVPGATVAMQEHVSGFDAVGRALVAVGSLGTACQGTVCSPGFGAGRTDGRGEYTVYLTRTPGDYDISVAAGATTVSAQVAYAARPLRLPDVTVWSFRPALEVSGTTARLRYAPPPAAVGREEVTRARFMAGDAEVLSLPDAGSGARFDARLIEDLAVTLVARVVVDGRLGETSYEASAPVRGTLRPVSRGSRCSEYGASGRPVTYAPCALADGDLVHRWTPRVPDFRCGGAPCDRKVVVDLGAVRALHYVAVRACDPFAHEVQVSADGRTWQTVVERHAYAGTDLDGICATAMSVRARYVRVLGPAGGFYSTFTEISVF
jgi:hypothetical protein